MIIIGIQARSGSTRLKHKSLRTIGDYSILQHCYNSCVNSGLTVVVLPPRGDQLIIDHCCNTGMDFFVSERTENDVLGRYIDAAQHFSANYIVRITGDCPFPNVRIPRNYGLYKFWSNAHPRLRTSPDGWDMEIISSTTLEELDDYSTEPEREHVTACIYRLPFLYTEKLCFARDTFDMSKLPKMSVDTAEDLRRMRKLYVS